MEGGEGGGKCAHKAEEKEKEILRERNNLKKRQNASTCQALC